MEVCGAVLSEHPVQPPLQAGEVIFQSHIEDGPLADFVPPQGESLAHMVGQLRHEKGFADLGSAHKEVHPRIEQALHHGRLAGVHLFVEFVHGEGGQIGRVVDPVYLPQDFPKIPLMGLVPFSLSLYAGIVVPSLLLVP